MTIVYQHGPIQTAHRELPKTGHPFTQGNITMGAAGAQKRGLSHLAGFADSPPPPTLFLMSMGLGSAEEAAEKEGAVLPPPLKPDLWAVTWAQRNGLMSQFRKSRWANEMLRKGEFIRKLMAPDFRNWIRQAACVSLDCSWLLPAKPQLFNAVFKEAFFCFQFSGRLPKVRYFLWSDDGHRS